MRACMFNTLSLIRQRFKTRPVDGKRTEHGKEIIEKFTFYLPQRRKIDFHFSSSFRHHSIFFAVDLRHKIYFVFNLVSFHLYKSRRKQNKSEEYLLSIDSHREV